MDDVNQMQEPIPSRSELVEEYKETLAYMRHDDQIAWTILGLSATIAFGVWAYTFKDVPWRSLHAVCLSLLGIVVFALGRLMAHSISVRTNWRRERAQAIESELGFKLVRFQPAKAFGVNRTLTYVAVGGFVVWLVYLLVFLTGAS
jgi:hypothetical protein